MFPAIQKNEIFNHVKILLAGGGTLGSVTPLLAVWEECAARGDTGLWVGTRTGPERECVLRMGAPFFWIFSGKLRRYFHWRNFFDPFFLVIGIVESLFLILRFKPDVIMSAGSFIGVPVIVAGSLLGKRCVAFQLDIEPSISNLIVQGFVDRIFASCPEAADSYSKKKTCVVGMPVRKALRDAATRSQSIPERNAARRSFGISDALPVVLVLGGGTGSTAVNQLVWSALPHMTDHLHVFHCTGKGKGDRRLEGGERYHSYDIAFDELPTLLLCADVVVSRAGFGTLAELSRFARATILIPMPNSHQEKNASFAESHGAARYVSQKTLTGESLLVEIDRLLDRQDERERYEKGMAELFPQDAHVVIADILHEMIRK